jgi:hypothetical protein
MVVRRVCPVRAKAAHDHHTPLLCWRGCNREAIGVLPWHSPWTTVADYPAPVVDLAESRKLALEFFKQNKR